VSEHGEWEVGGLEVWRFGGWKWEVGSWRWEVGGGKLEVGGGKLEVRKLEVRK